MKRFIRCMLLLTLVLGLAGCSEPTEEKLRRAEEELGVTAAFDGLTLSI